MTRRDPSQGSRYWGLIRRQGERVGPVTEPSEPSPPVPAKTRFPHSADWLVKWPCQALHCEWRGEATECPDHGIGAYYRDGRKKYGPEWNSGD